MDSRRLAIDAVEADKGVDLQVGEMQVGVDRVEADQEVGEGVLLRVRDVRQEGLFDVLAGGELVSDFDGQAVRFGVDVADVDSAFVREEDLVAVAVGVDADVVFGVRGVGEEGLDDEGAERPSHRLDLDKYNDTRQDGWMSVSPESIGEQQVERDVCE